MPNKPKKICVYPGCVEFIDSKYCEQHAPKHNHKNYDKQRGSASERGYNSRWREYRLHFLKHNPLCTECMKQGRYVPATVVDHIIPHKGDKKLFWDKNNHQSLCKHCHDVKTSREDGGFGNIRSL